MKYSQAAASQFPEVCIFVAKQIETKSESARSSMHPGAEDGTQLITNVCYNMRWLNKALMSHVYPMGSDVQRSVLPAVTVLCLSIEGYFCKSRFHNQLPTSSSFKCVKLNNYV